MIDRLRRKGMTRIVALAVIGLMSAAPAEALDLTGTPKLQSLGDCGRAGVRRQRHRSAGAAAELRGDRPGRGELLRQ